MAQEPPKFNPVELDKVLEENMTPGQKIGNALEGMLKQLQRGGMVRPGGTEDILKTFNGHTDEDE